MSLLTLPLDVQRLLINEYLRDEDATVVRCACSALRALVSRTRVDACRQRLHMYFCARGYVTLLAWLHHHVPLRERYPGALCAEAAQIGHLPALQWLRANNAPWDGLTCACAADGGHLEVLQWSRLLAGERLRAPTARRGTNRRARLRREAAISRYCNGRAQTARHGTEMCVRLPPWVTIWRCCNGAACSQASGCARPWRRMG